MITEYTVKDSSSVLTVINDAAVKYKGVIPDECWHEPYMSKKKLINEINIGVNMYGYNHDDILICVIGIH